MKPTVPLLAFSKIKPLPGSGLKSNTPKHKKHPPWPVCYALDLAALRSGFCLFGLGLHLTMIES